MVTKHNPEVSMARIRYLIRRLSVQAMLSYAKPIDKEH